MRFPRSLTLPLLMSIWIAPCVAQSPKYLAPPPLPNIFARQPLPASRIPPMDFNGKAGSVPRLSSRTIRQLNPFVFHPNDLYALQAPSFTESQHDAILKAMEAVRLEVPRTLIARNDGRCYTLREYQFSRVAPDSDATKLSGYSTCEPAGRVHLKGAIVR